MYYINISLKITLKYNMNIKLLFKKAIWFNYLICYFESILICINPKML